MWKYNKVNNVVFRSSEELSIREQYKIDGDHKWIDNQELTINDDFILKTKYIEPDDSIHCNRGADVTFAFPIETQDELLREIRDIGIASRTYSDWAKECKEKFIIKRK